MGPLATIDIFKKIVENTPVKKDQEHIPILIANIPQVPDRTKSILDNGESPVPAIVESGKKLEQAGADFLIIPCNTSHYYFDEIAKSFDIPIVNMVDLTVDAVSKCGFKKVAVIGTSGTIKTGIYQKKFAEKHVVCAELSEEETAIVDDAIYNVVKAGNFSRDISKFIDLMDKLLKDDAEIIVLACTELPVLFKTYNLTYKTIDPTELLALESINIALDRRN